MSHNLSIKVTTTDCDTSGLHSGAVRTISCDSGYHSASSSSSFDFDFSTASADQILASTRSLDRQRSSGNDLLRKMYQKHMPPFAAAMTDITRSTSNDSGMCSEELDDGGRRTPDAEYVAVAQPMRRSADAKDSPAMPFWQICYAPDENGDTQLHLAICGGLSNAVANIIRLAPSSDCLDRPNDIGRCAMHYAVLTGQHQVIAWLRERGAKTYVRDHEGNTPLHLACLNGDLDSVRALTEPLLNRRSGREIDERNYNGEHCVHIAARNGRLDILRHLVLVCEADVNARDGRSGHSVLHIACQQRDKSKSLLAFLLGACADRLHLDTPSYGQQTAYQMAYRCGDRCSMVALADAGAQPIDASSSDDEDMTSESSSDEDWNGTTTQMNAMASDCGSFRMTGVRNEE